jgi:nucleoside-diphosphate-sugar epimerase
MKIVVIGGSGLIGSKLVSLLRARGHELGIATASAHGTFELLRKSGRKAILRCPFLVHFINTHPEYADVVEV